MQALLGQKIEQSQRFLEDGTRIPVTVVSVAPNPVVAVMTQAKNGYNAVQIGFGTAKKPRKSLLGITKKANLQNTPKMLREVRLSDDTLPTVGDLLKATDIFKPGDIIQVTGMSKGKGWAGGVKRHHFKGGPRTHGQSDRERAPGSIGQTTTPGRVYKGKRMAGRMGHEQVTVKNLKVVDVTQESLLIAGLVPGPVNNVVLIQKIGEDKKFVPLYSDAKPEEEAREETEEVLKGTDQAGEEVSKGTKETKETEEKAAEVLGVEESALEPAQTESVELAVDVKPEEAAQAKETASNAADAKGSDETDGTKEADNSAQEAVSKEPTGDKPSDASSLVESTDDKKAMADKKEEKEDGK